MVLFWDQHNKKNTNLEDLVSSPIFSCFVTEAKPKILQFLIYKMERLLFQITLMIFINNLLLSLYYKIS